jgi:uncharacterized protein (TIGR00369 family)
VKDRKTMDAISLQNILDSAPFHKLFPMTVEHVDLESQSIRVRLTYQNHFERAVDTGQIHGGVMATLIDIVGDFALIALLDFGVPTINFRVDYLRPAFNTDLIATAQVRRAGRTVGVVDIDVHSADGKLCALGRGCYGTQKG